MADGKVTILVDVDGNKVKVLNDELDKVANKGQKGQGALKGFAASGLAFQVAGKAMNVLSNSLGSAVERFDTLEKFPIVMKSLGYNTDEVTRSTEKLSNGIDGLPTSLSEVVSNTQQLVTVTGDLDQATDLTLALNDAFLASGASSSDAARGIVQYTQMLSSGKVDMMSWRTLQETMPLALQKTAEAFGYTGASAKKDLYAALQSGKVTFKEFNAQLIKLDKGVGGFADMAKKNSTGIGTSFKNLGNAITKGVANIIKAFDDLSKKVTGKSIAEHLDSLKGVVNAAFKAMNTAIKATAPVFEALFAVVKAGIPLFEKLTPLIIAAGAAFVAFKAIQKVSSWMASMNTAVSSFNTVIQLATAKQVASTAAYAANAGVLKAGTVAYGLLTGQISLATAAQTAWSAAVGIASKVWGTLTATMAANPVGAFVAGVTVLTGGLIALSGWLGSTETETKKMADANQKYKEKTDELVKSIKEQGEAHKKNVEDIHAEGVAIDKQIESLIKLSEKQGKTAKDHKEIKNAVSDLNEALGSSAIEYNKQTEQILINGKANKDALQTLKEAYIAEKDYAEQKSAQTEADKNTVKLKNELTEALKKQSAAQKEFNEAEKELAAMANEEKAHEYMKRYDDAKVALDSANDSVKSLKQSIQEQQAASAAAAEAMSADSAKMAESEQNAAAGAIIAYSDLSEAQRSAIDAMQERYSALQESSTNAFETIKQNEAISAAQMTENLNQNIAAMEQWANNLKVLASRGLDEGLIAKLQEAGPAAAAQTQALVNSSDDELQKLNDAYTRAGESSKNSFKTAMDAMNIEIPNSLMTMVTNIKSGLDVQVAAAGFANVGTKIPEGVKTGVEQGSSKLSGAAAKMAEITKNKFKEEMGIHSPSRVFTDFGGNITKGLENGIKQGQNGPVSATGSVGNKMKNKFKNMRSEFSAIGGHAMSGLASGISSNSGSAIAAAQSVAARITATIRAAMKIHSPSRVMRDQVGVFIPQGIAVGIEKGANSVDAAMLKLRDSMVIKNPEQALGLDKTIGVSAELKNVSKQSISEKITVSVDKMADYANRAIDVAEDALRRPVEVVLDDGTLVGAITPKITNLQKDNNLMSNLRKGIIV